MHVRKSLDHIKRFYRAYGMLLLWQMNFEFKFYSIMSLFFALSISAVICYVFWLIVCACVSVYVLLLFYAPSSIFLFFACALHFFIIFICLCVCVCEVVLLLLLWLFLFFGKKIVVIVVLLSSFQYAIHYMFLINTTSKTKRSVHIANINTQIANKIENGSVSKMLYDKVGSNEKKTV